MTKPFDEYLKKRIVKISKKDSEKAASLVMESNRKLDFLQRQVEAFGIDNEIANEYILLCYDSLMLILRAKMSQNGYNVSGVGSHEAVISYLTILGFSKDRVDFLEKMRYYRNGMLYYGKKLDGEYAQKVIDYTKKIYSQLAEIQ